MGVQVREKPKGSGIWWVFINHQGKRKSKKIGSDKRLAKQIAEKIDARLVLGDVGIIEDNNTPTFSEYAERWVTIHVPATCKRSSEKAYHGILNNHLESVFSEKLITDITRLQVKEFLMKKYKDGLAQSTVTHIKNALGGIFNLAIDDEIISINPAHHLGKIFGKKSLESTYNISPLSKEELSLLLNVFREYFTNHYPIILTLARTGMRVGEACGLQWGDIDFDGRFINIQRSYSHGHIETPKNGKPRRVDMSMQLTEVLWRLKRRRINDIIKWLFPNEAGNPIDSHNWRKRVFDKALQKAGLRRIRIHDLRHTYASLLIQAGESLAYVQNQLGHHSIKLTVDVYGHLAPEGNKEAVDKLDDFPKSAPIRTLSAPTI